MLDDQLLGNPRFSRPQLHHVCSLHQVLRLELHRIASGIEPLIPHRTRNLAARGVDHNDRYRSSVGIEKRISVRSSNGFG